MGSDFSFFQWVTFVIPQWLLCWDYLVLFSNLSVFEVRDFGYKAAGNMLGKWT
jgi:hypothetical protein